MPLKREGLGERPDGRLYSRITRRCVVLLRHIKVGRKFELIEVAREINEESYPEFQTFRGGQFVQIRPERIRDYLTYLADLKLIELAEKRYTLKFAKPSSDGHWAQALSDVAREHLAGLFGTSVSKLPEHLENLRRKLHQKQKVPTVTAILGEAGVEGARSEEVFRWSLYLYTDGDASPFDLRQYPHLVKKL
jgi:hypothetical protein